MMAWRSVVHAEHGMVATSHPLATQTGVRVLRAGGNAIDAALAAAAVAWVTMPMMAGPGGDAFLIIHRPGEAPVAINGSGPVGKRASVEYLASLGHTSMMPADGPLSASVPGLIDAFDVAMRYGSLGWDAVLADAITYAEAHPLAPRVAAWFTVDQARLTRFETTARTYFSSGRAPRAGEILRQPAYAASLRRIAADGRDGFYGGALGEEIARHQEAYGLFDGDDLASMRAEVTEPLSVDYRGHTIHQLRPPSQGMIHLEEMSILSHFDVAGLSSAQAHHVMIEAKKIAFADRNRWAGDPAFVDVPLDRLLSPAYTAERAAGISMDRAMPVDAYAPASENTTYLCAADRDGNAVSLIQSLSHTFGSAEIVGDTGLFLNNRAGRGFVLDPGHPNCIAPGKRTMHTLNCFSVTRDGRPYLVGGTPGGDGQPQWNMQVLVDLLDRGVDIQAAVEAPRWIHNPSTDPGKLMEPPLLAIESTAGPEVIDALRTLGHQVDVVAPLSAGGSTQLIRIDEERSVLSGASDPRGDGQAAGY